MLPVSVAFFLSSDRSPIPPAHTCIHSWLSLHVTSFSTQAWRRLVHHSHTPSFYFIPLSTPLMHPHQPCGPKPLQSLLIPSIAKKALLTLRQTQAPMHTPTHILYSRGRHSPCSGSGPQYLSGASLIVLISSLGTVGRHDTLPDHHHRHMNTLAQPWPRPTALSGWDVEQGQGNTRVTIQIQLLPGCCLDAKHTQESLMQSGGKIRVRKRKKSAWVEHGFFFFFFTNLISLHVFVCYTVCSWGSGYCWCWTLSLF